MTATRLRSTAGIVASVMLALASMLAGCAKPPKISKEMTVEHRMFFIPQVTDKQAVETQVDAVSGNVTVSYELTFEDVQTQDDTDVTIDAVSIENPRGSAITVRIVDRLFCDAGGGVAGSLVADVLDTAGIVIAAGATHSAGPFGPFDASACSDVDSDGIREVVNRVEVFDDPGGNLLASAELGPTHEFPISGIVAGQLVDVEELPVGWSLATASLTDPDSNAVAVTSSVSGQEVTVSAQPGARGVFVLEKTLVRDKGLECEPQVLYDEAFAKSIFPEDDTIYGSIQHAHVSFFCGGGGVIQLAKKMHHHRSMWNEPRLLSKQAAAASVDGASGTVTVRYELEVDYVLVEDNTGVDVLEITVLNTGASPVTVNIEDQLFCDDGSGGPGALVAAVHSASGQTINGGSALQAGPFPGALINACSDVDGGGLLDAVNRIEVVDAATTALLAEHDFPTSSLVPPDITAISGIAAGRLVDVEAIPAGWQVDSASMTLDGAPFAGFTTSASGQTFTVQIAPQTPAGIYTLTKVLTSRQCQSGTVHNKAYVDNGVDGPGNSVFGDTAAADVEITCGE